MADRLAALWQPPGEVEVPLWQEPVQGVTRIHPAPSLEPASLDNLLCGALKVQAAGRAGKHFISNACC